MSFLTGRQAELIFAGLTAGTALSNTTTATCISPRGNTTPLPYLPPGFFSAAYGQNQKLKIVARGVISTAASSPGTLTLAAYLATTDTATLGTSVCASGAFTPATSLSNAIFEIDLTVTCGAPGPVPNLYGFGKAMINPAAADGAEYGMGSVTAVTSLSTEAAYYVQIGATWGTASASNSITMYDTEIWGLN